MNKIWMTSTMQWISVLKQKAVCRSLDNFLQIEENPTIFLPSFSPPLFTDTASLCWNCSSVMENSSSEGWSITVKQNTTATKRTSWGFLFLLSTGDMNSVLSLSRRAFGTMKTNSLLIEQTFQLRLNLEISVFLKLFRDCSVHTVGVHMELYFPACDPTSFQLNADFSAHSRQTASVM